MGGRSSRLPSLGVLQRCPSSRGLTTGQGRGASPKASRVHAALQSGQVDECGICDGLGDSCALLLALSASMTLSSEQVSR